MYNFFWDDLFFGGRHDALCRDTECWLTNPATYIRVWRMYWCRILYCCVFFVIIQINIWCNNTSELKTGKDINRFEIAFKVLSFFFFLSCLFSNTLQVPNWYGWDCNGGKGKWKSTFWIHTVLWELNTKM